MVLIQVQGMRFNLSDRDAENSVTLQEAVEYDEQYGINVPITIGVTLHDWNDYLRFIETGNYPVVTALHVIDYLNNVQQARDWFWKKVDDQQKVDGYTLNQAFENVLDSIKYNTVFTVKEILPYLTTNKAQDAVPYLATLTSLPKVYIDHIVSRQPVSKRETYHKLINYDTFDDIPKDIIKDAKRFGIILKPLHGNIIRSIVNPCYSLDDETTYIMLWAATYYPNIRIYRNPQGTLVFGPTDRPYLQSVKRTVFGNPRHVWTANQNLEGYKPVNVYNPHSTYKPGVGFDTSLKIQQNFDNHQYDNILYSLNQPSFYHRDYYIFMTVGCDPFANIVYAYSV